MKVFVHLRKAFRALRHSFRKQLPEPVPCHKNPSVEISSPTFDQLTNLSHEQTQSSDSTSQTRLQNAGLTRNTRAPLSALEIPTPNSPTPYLIPGNSGNSPARLSPVASVLTHRHSSASVISNSGQSFKSNFSVDLTWLCNELRYARIEPHGEANSSIIPICKQKLLITPANIEREIREAKNNQAIFEPIQIKEVAEEAPQVFATLVLAKRGVDIFGLLRDGISDKDLPLQLKKGHNGEFTLERQSGIPIKTFESWTGEKREDFGRMQWWMIAPIFKMGKHHIFDPCAILPFVSFAVDEKVGKTIESGYSDVFARKIHPSHHNFCEFSDWKNGDSLVAIKQLHFSDLTEFQNEAHILRELGSLKPKDAHLITLLATYEHRGKYHFVFPRADANLKKYWKDRPSPNFDEPTFLWVVTQIAGMAHALKSIHNFTQTSAKSGEEAETLYGRHGDIKPENILWFANSPAAENEMGILQITDFGLGKFYGRYSRSNIDPAAVVSSPAYEPPECKLNKSVSRAYDIWSLGRLYLEFTSWLLTGSTEIDDFAREESFFAIINDGRGAKVRDEVLAWVEKLRECERCSALMHDLLDLIMEKVLVLDVEKRIQSVALWNRLQTLLEKAKQDRIYLLQPVPRNQRLRGYQLPSRTNTVGSYTSDKDHKPTLNFSNGDRLGFPSTARPSFSKDLAFRAAGTPAHPGHLRKANTLPAGLLLGKVNS